MQLPQYVNSWSVKIACPYTDQADPYGSPCLLALWAVSQTARTSSSRSSLTGHQRSQLTVMLPNSELHGIQYVSFSSHVLILGKSECNWRRGVFLSLARWVTHWTQLYIRWNFQSGGGGRGGEGGVVWPQTPWSAISTINSRAPFHSSFLPSMRIFGCCP